MLHPPFWTGLRPAKALFGNDYSYHMKTSWVFLFSFTSELLTNPSWSLFSPFPLFQICLSWLDSVGRNSAMCQDRRSPQISFPCDPLRKVFMTVTTCFHFLPFVFKRLPPVTKEPNVFIWTASTPGVWPPHAQMKKIQENTSKLLSPPPQINFTKGFVI